MLKTVVSTASGLLFCTISAWAQCTVPNTLANGTNADATQVMANFSALLTCINTPPPSGGLPTAQGRLTLATGAPVMTSAQIGKTTIYYTPYVGNQILITTNGTSFTAMTFTELSNVTTNSSTGNAGPAAVAVNSNYDLFVWSNSGTLVLTRGPAWTSDIARGSGAGTTALQRVAGLWTNANAITNGPGANLGTYVGTVRSDGSSQINWVPGGFGVNGIAGMLGVWNTYNRVGVSGILGDTTSSWPYTTATWRAANGSTTMRVSFVQGLQEDSFSADYTAMGSNSVSGDFYTAGVGYDSMSAVSGGFVIANTPAASYAAPTSGRYTAQPLGFHYMQAVEYSQAAGATTWYGNNSTGSAPLQSSLTYSGRF